MTRFHSLAFLVAPLLAASPAAAAESQPATYRAELASPGSAERLIVRDTLWRCDGASCAAPKSNSRPAVACAALARKAGALRSFTVEGQAMAAADLEKCNARAR